MIGTTEVPVDSIKKYNKEFYTLIDTAYLNNIINKKTLSFIRNNFPKVEKVPPLRSV